MTMGCCIACSTSFNNQRRSPEYLMRRLCAHEAVNKFRKVIGICCLAWGSLWASMDPGQRTDCKDQDNRKPGSRHTCKNIAICNLYRSIIVCASTEGLPDRKARSAFLGGIRVDSQKKKQESNGVPPIESSRLPKLHST